MSDYIIKHEDSGSSIIFKEDGSIEIKCSKLTIISESTININAANIVSWTTMLPGKPNPVFNKIK